MTAGQMATIIEAGIGVLIGLYASLLGHRVVGKKPGESPDYDKWHEAWGGTLKALGPVIAACSALTGAIMLLNGAATR
jgi:hypothetical protein